MQALAQTDDRLQIGKLSLEYSVCGNQATAESARQRLDRLLEKTLRQQLTGMFEPLRAAGDGLWFIRRLELAADIDLELNDRDIMRNWSRQFAQALQRNLLDQTSEKVIYFENYPQYLARFISDLANGCAWHAWYYQSFAGLRALPANMAIVTALLQQPELGLQALSGLPRADRARVINALTAQGAQRLITALATIYTSSSIASSELLPAVIVELEQQAGIPLVVSDHPWLETLELYLRVTTRHPRFAGESLAELLLAVVTLGDLVMSLSNQSFAILSTALLRRNVAAVFHQLPVKQAQRLQALITLQRSEIHHLLTVIQPDVEIPQATQCNDEPRYTPFGGAFLLLAMLQELPLETMLENWPEPASGNKQAVIRLLLLAQCMGKNQAGRVFRDPVVRDLAGVPPSLTAIELTDWLESIRPRQIQAAQQHYIQWRLSTSDSDQFAVKHCAYAHRSLAIVSEPKRDCWLLLRGYQPRRNQPLQQLLKRIIPEGINGQMLLGEQQKSLRADLDYLQLPATLLPNNSTRWLLTVMTQGMLKDFAWRLPGFAHSSLPHLRDNFLCVSARLESEPERWLLHLSRPPLNVVLSMTGMARNHYRLAWLDNQRVELYQGD